MLLLQGCSVARHANVLTVSAGVCVNRGSDCLFGAPVAEGCVLTTAAASSLCAGEEL